MEGAPPPATAGKRVSLSGIRKYSQQSPTIPPIPQQIYDSPHPFRTIGRLPDAAVLRPGKKEPLVHSRLCRVLCPGVDLWIPTRSVALRTGGIYLGNRGGAALVAGDEREFRLGAIVPQVRAMRSPDSSDANLRRNPALPCRELRQSAGDRLSGASWSHPWDC